MRSNPKIIRFGKQHRDEILYVEQQDLPEMMRKVVPEMWEQALQETFAHGRNRDLSGGAMFNVVAEEEPYGRSNMAGKVLSMTIETKIAAIYPVDKTVTSSTKEIAAANRTRWESGEYGAAFMRGSSFNVYPPLTKSAKTFENAIVFDSYMMGYDPTGARPYFSKPLREWRDAVYAAWKFSFDRNQEAGDRIVYVEARGCEVVIGEKKWKVSILVEVSGSVDYVAGRS